MPNLPAILESQFRAALAMIADAIEKCADDFWDDPTYENRTWRIAYHALFYTHFYLSPSEAEHKPWRLWIPKGNFMEEELPAGTIITREDLLDYVREIEEMVPVGIAAVPFDDPSGFPWIPFSRLELHIYNIRHLQHHTGQIADRVRSCSGEGVDWIGMAPATSAS